MNLEPPAEDRDPGRSGAPPRRLRRLAGLAAIGLGCLAPAKAAPPDAQVLRPGVPARIFVAPGHATTVLFRTSQKLAAISLGSPVVAYKYDKSLNQLELIPAGRTAGLETNLNLRIGPDVYVLEVTVVDDSRLQLERTFVLEDDSSADDESPLAQARPLPPEQIDLVGAARTLDRMETDPVFAASRPDVRIEPIGKNYAWNGCLVRLVDLIQFLDTDLLVFRVQWLNRTADALYLDGAQYGLFVRGRSIPIAASYQVGAGPVAYPGELRTAYLAVQGLRLSRHNDWELGLPPDAAAVGRMLER